MDKGFHDASLHAQTCLFADTCPGILGNIKDIQCIITGCVGERKAHDREKFSKIGIEIPLLPSKKTFSPLQLQNAKGPASNRTVNLEPERLHPEFHSVFIGFIKCKKSRIRTSQSFEKTCNRRSIKKAHGSP